jgi:hypothetical protein
MDTWSSFRRGKRPQRGAHHFIHLLSRLIMCGASGDLHDSCTSLRCGTWSQGQLSSLILEEEEEENRKIRGKIRSKKSKKEEETKEEKNVIM